MAGHYVKATGAAIDQVKLVHEQSPFSRDHSAKTAPAHSALRRCPWVSRDALYQQYHDQEWGYPMYDPKVLYELLILEIFQAGLSWLTVLRKREGFRKAFADFQPHHVAAFEDSDIERLLQDPGIIRHRGKITAAVSGARVWLDLEEAHPGGFSAFIWDSVDGQPRINHWSEPDQVPSETPESRVLSDRLRQAGFRFLGPTTCYAFMQAAGLVDDHLLICFRRATT